MDHSPSLNYIAPSKPAKPPSKPSPSTPPPTKPRLAPGAQRIPPRARRHLPAKCVITPLPLPSSTAVRPLEQRIIKRGMHPAEPPSTSRTTTRPPQPRRSDTPTSHPAGKRPPDGIVRTQAGWVEVVAADVAEPCSSSLAWQHQGAARGAVDLVLVVKVWGRKVGGGDGAARGRRGEGVRGWVRVGGCWWGQVGGEAGRVVFSLRGLGLLRLGLFGVAFFLEGGEEALDEGYFEEGGEVCDLGG